MALERLPDAWIITPAYNEAPVLGDVLTRLLSVATNIVVVDDGSTDDTAGIARSYPVHVVRHPVNLGQGAAIQTGIDYALIQGAQIVVTFDADGQMDEREIPKLCSLLVSNKVDVVLGSRFLEAKPSQMPVLRRGLIRLWTSIMRVATGMRVTDAHNGFRAIGRSAATRFRLQRNRMAHASEILSAIKSYHLTYMEAAVSIGYTPYSLGKGQRLSQVFAILWDLLFT